MWRVPNIQPAQWSYAILCRWKMFNEFYITCLSIWNIQNFEFSQQLPEHYVISFSDRSNSVNIVNKYFYIRIQNNCCRMFISTTEMREKERKKMMLMNISSCTIGYNGKCLSSKDKNHHTNVFCCFASKHYITHVFFGPNSS